MGDNSPIICPICNKQRPTYEDILAYKDAPEGSELYARVEDYNTCCNPMCKGNWGTGCWHCHHPKFLESCSDERILRIAFDARCIEGIGSKYWEHLIKLPSERILDAWQGQHRPAGLSEGEWRNQHLELTRFSTMAQAQSNGGAEKLKLKAETIMECQLAVCKYCDASAKSGETTVHTCVADPLKQMLHDIALQLYGEETASG